jgi:hypothetical protein
LIEYQPPNFFFFFTFFTVLAKIFLVVEFHHAESDETQEEPDSKKTWRLSKIFGHCNCSTSQQLNGNYIGVVSCFVFISL